MVMVYLLYNLFRLKIYDEYNDEEVEVTRKELRLVRRLLKGKAPHADFDPYAVCSSDSFHAPSFVYGYHSCTVTNYLLHCMLGFNFFFTNCSLMLIGLNGMMPSTHSQMLQNRRGGSFLQNGKVRR